VLPFAWEKASLAIGKYIPANVEPLAVFPVTFLLQLIRLVTLKKVCGLSILISLCGNNIV
jgi:hypothetical protein